MTLKQIKSDTVQQYYCAPFCDWLAVNALVFLCNKWESHGIQCKKLSLACMY